MRDSDFYGLEPRTGGSFARRPDRRSRGGDAEEIESIGKTEKRELVSRLTVLLLYLFKWRHQPSHRGKSWRLSIANARNEIIDHLEDNPSLKAVVDSAIEQAYRSAHPKAAIETEFDEDRVPGPLSLEFCRDDG